MNTNGGVSSVAKSFSTTEIIAFGVPPARDTNAMFVGWEIAEASLVSTLAAATQQSISGFCIIDIMLITS